MIIVRRWKFVLSLFLFAIALPACAPFSPYVASRSFDTIALATIQPLALNIEEQCSSQEILSTPYCSVLEDHNLFDETYRNFSQHRKVSPVKLAFFTDEQKACADYLSEEDCALSSLDVDICLDASCRENNADIIVMQNTHQADVVDVFEKNPNALLILPLDDYLSFSEDQSLQKDRILWISGEETCDALPEHHRSSCIRVSAEQQEQYAHHRDDAAWVGTFASKILSLWRSKIDNPYALRDVLSFCRTDSLTINDACFFDEKKTNLSLNLFSVSPKNVKPYAPPPETYAKYARSREENRLCVTYVSWCDPVSSPQEVIDTDARREEAIEGYSDMISSYRSRGGQGAAIRIGVFFSPDHVPTDEEKSILETATLNSHVSRKKKNIVIDYIPCDIDPSTHVCKDESYQYDIVVLQQYAFLSDVTLGEREGSISADIILLPHQADDGIIINEDGEGAPFYGQEERIVQLSLFCSNTDKPHCFSTPLTGNDKNFNTLSHDSLYAEPGERSIMAGTLLGITLAQFDHFSPRSSLADILPPIAECDWSFSCFFKDGKFSSIENDIPVLPYIFDVPTSSSPVFALENHCIHLLFSLCKGDSNDNYTAIVQEYYARSTNAGSQENYRIYISGLDNVDPLLFPEGIFCDTSIDECGNIPIQNIRCSTENCPHKADIFYVDAQEGNAQVNNIDDNHSPVVIVVINAAEAQDLVNGDRFQFLANKTYTGTVFTAKDEATCSILSAYSCFVTTDEVNVYGEHVDGSLIFLSTVAYLSSISGYTAEGEYFVHELLAHCRNNNNHLNLQECIAVEAANIFIPLYRNGASSPSFVENILRSSPSPILSSADLFAIDSAAFSCPSHSTMCDGLFKDKEEISIPGFTLLDHYYKQKQDEIANDTTGAAKTHSRPITFSIANHALKKPLLETLGSYVCFESAVTTCSDTNAVFHVKNCISPSCHTSTSDILVLASSPDAISFPHRHIEETSSLVISDAKVMGSLSLDNLLVAIASGADCPHLGHCLEVPSVFAAYDDDYLHLRSNHALGGLTRTSILATVSGYIFWLWPFMTTKSTTHLLLECGEQQEDGRSPSLSLACLAGNGSSLRASTINNSIISYENDELSNIYHPNFNSCLISLCPGVPLWVGETPLTNVDAFLSSTILGYDQFLAIYHKAHQQGLVQKQIKVAFAGNTTYLSDETSSFLMDLPTIIGEMFHKEQANAWLCPSISNNQCDENVPIVIESHDCSLTNEACFDTSDIDVLVVYDSASLPQNLENDTLLIIGSIGYDSNPPSLSSYGSHALLESDLDRIIFAFDVEQASSVYLPKKTSCSSLLHLASSCISLPSIVHRYSASSINEETYVTSAAVLAIIAAQTLSLFPALRPSLLKSVLTSCTTEGGHFSLECLVDDQSIELPLVCPEGTQDDCYDGRYQITLQPKDVPFYQDEEQATQCHALNSLCAGIRLTKDAHPSNGIAGYATLVYNMLNVKSVIEKRTSINIATLLPLDNSGRRTLQQRQEEARTSMMIMASVAAQEECVESIYTASIEELTSSVCNGEYVVPRLLSCDQACDVDHSIRVLHTKHLERENFEIIEKTFPQALVITESGSGFYEPLFSFPIATIYAGSWVNTPEGQRTTRPCYATFVCLLSPSTFYGFSKNYQRLAVHSMNASTEVIAGVAALLFTLFPNLDAKQMLTIMVSCSNATSTGNKIYLSLGCYDGIDNQSTSTNSASSISSIDTSKYVVSRPSVGGLSFHNKAPGSLLWRSTFSAEDSTRESFVSNLMPWASVFAGYASLQEDIIYMQDGLGAYSGLDVTIPAFSFLIEGRVVGVLGVHNVAPILTEQQATLTMEGGASLGISKKIATPFAPMKISLQGACFSGSATLFASTLLLSAKPSCQISLGARIAF